MHHRQDREIQIFDKIIVPSADFAIFDEHGTTPILDLILESARRERIPLVFLDENETLYDLMENIGNFERMTFPYVKKAPEENPALQVYPIISNDESEILDRLETFLKRFYAS